MYFFTLVLGLWLIPKADTLQCYECIPNIYGNCIDKTSECPSQDYQCAASRLTSFRGDSKIYDITAKRCAQAKECFEGSYNFGLSKTTMNTDCCTGNLCNTEPAPYSSLVVSNGKQCFTCKGTDCTGPLNCEGSEDHCIKATLTAGGVTQIVKGCASKQFCSGDVTAQAAHLTGADFSCCQGNFCNSASGPSGGLLLLMVPLISFILFS